MVINTVTLDSEVARLSNEVVELTQQLKKFINTPNDQYDVIGMEEVCKLTGYSKNTIYQYVNQGKIPYHKAKHGGRKLIFFRTEIESWLRGKKPETVEEYCDRKELELCNEYKGGLN